MLRRILTCAAAASILAGTAAHAATFDDKTGTFRLDADLALAQSFDGPKALESLPTRVVTVDRRAGYARFGETTETIAPEAFVAEADAVEGKGALRIDGDRALVLGDAASFAPFAFGRVEVRFFGRADGAAPELRAMYAKGPLDTREMAFPLAQIIAYRTGRATSDGWVEYATGAIDGSIRGAPLSGIVLMADGDGARGTSFLVDALEVHRVPGELLSTGECSIALEASQCKKGAACIEGACIDAAAVYGALPPVATRRAIVERTTTYLTRFQDDRHASAAAAEGFAKEMPAIAEAAATPDAFFRPYASWFGRARGAHTSAPAPAAYARIAASSTRLVRYYGTELNACFGLVERDWSGGGRGYAVYQTASPSALAVGDVVDTVDGEPVDAWIARVAPENGLFAADPDGDRALVAFELHGIVMRYGRTLGAKRCTAEGACTTVSIDLAELRQHPEAIEKMTCGPRFRLAVPVPTGVDPDAYEAAITSTDGGITSLHTNGEPMQDATWVSTVKSAFEGASSRLLVDKRRGDGGGGDALKTWATYMRRPYDFGLFFVGRVDHAQIDGPPGFLDDLFGTCDGSSFMGKCALAQKETFVPAPGSLPAKVAWLNVLDGSASDMATYFAKGATGVRIFAPNRTLGLFGSLGIMPAFLPGWSGGSVQFGDTRDGQTADARKAGIWLSGHGIAPDEVVVQRESDLVLGRDTMLERARAWLLEE